MARAAVLGAVAVFWASDAEKCDSFFASANRRIHVVGVCIPLAFRQLHRRSECRGGRRNAHAHGVLTSVGGVYCGIAGRIKKNRHRGPGGLSVAVCLMYVFRTSCMLLYGMSFVRSDIISLGRRGGLWLRPRRAPVRC